MSISCSQKEKLDIVVLEVSRDAFFVTRKKKKKKKKGRYLYD